MVKAYSSKAQQDQEEKITLAYLTAYWQRVKKMPSLNSILNKNKPKKNMTDQEISQQIKMLNALLGGDVK